MPLWTCCDNSGTHVEITADSAREAAEEYVSDGDWGESTKTLYVTVYCTDEDGDTEQVRVTVDPTEPGCGGVHGEDHKWAAPHWAVGGIEENPGVHGHGGGVVSEEICMRCGLGRVTDSWAQDPENGEQGLTSVEYTNASDGKIQIQRYLSKAFDGMLAAPPEDEDGFWRLIPDTSTNPEDFEGACPEGWTVTIEEAGESATITVAWDD